MSWTYDPEALADWLDKQFDENEELQDRWWRESIGYNKLEPFWQSVSTINRYTSDPGLVINRTGSFVARGFIDVLRLGTGISSDQGAWENFKGGASNGLRILAISGPLFRFVGAAARGVGLRATAGLKAIAGADGPCSYVATNNILSYLSGNTVQFFRTLDDIILIRGKNAGHQMGSLLTERSVAEKLAALRIELKPLKMDRVEQAIAAAKAGDSPLIISVEWIKTDGERGAHAIVLAKDSLGNLKYLDFVDNVPGFRGFNSLAEMVAKRPHWGPNFVNNLKLIPGTYVLELSNSLLRAIAVTDQFALAIPILVAARWAEGISAEERVHNMLRSAWQFVSQAKRQSLVPPPLPSPKTINRIAQLNGAGPVATGLGITRHAPVPAAAGAPRIDWLTGVQYRLRYLNYYDGEIHGNNDEATRKAVLHFQKEWFKESHEWDGIPGPRTQARLKLIVGW